MRTDGHAPAIGGVFGSTDPSSAWSPLVVEASGTADKPGGLHTFRPARVLRLARVLLRDAHVLDLLVRDTGMNNAGRGCLAALVSWKLGGGLVSTVILFVVVYFALQNC